MRQSLEKSKKNMQQGWIAAIVWSVIATILCIVANPDLDRIMVSLSFSTLVMSVVFLVLHKMVGNWMLEPMNASLRQLDEEREVPERICVKALTVIDSIPFLDSLVSFFLWMTVMGAVGLFVYLYQGMTSWQLSIFAVVACAVAALNGVLSYQSDQVGLDPARRAVEKGISASLTADSTGTLVNSFSRMAAICLLVVIALSSTAWFGQLRQRQIESLLGGQEATFRQVAGSLEKMIDERGGVDWKKLLSSADPGSRMRNNLLITDSQGKILLNSTALEVSPEWLGRIRKTEAQSSRDFSAPFVFLSRRMSQGKVLFWVAPESGLFDAMGLSLTRPFGGLLVAWLLGILMAWAVARSRLHPVSVLVDRLKNPSLFRCLLLPPEGQTRELNGLVEALEGYTSQMTHSIDEAAGNIKSLQAAHSHLFEQVRHIRETTDRRTHIAEQTATSVSEMRSSIQGIAEQIGTLSEASADCSSAMFEIDQSIREVAGSAENLQGQVDDTASAMTEITASMSQVNTNVDDLAKAAEETVSSIAAIEASIKQVEENTSTTHKLSEDVSEFAERGAESVRQTIVGINDIQQITDEAQEVINRLGAKMDAVGKILTVIGDVAEQTNLLALNAAIIAAAAGEHGKGFAVVADEIKDLADRTSTSTKEIAGLIRSVQAESRRAIDAMQRGSGSVRRGVELANNAGNSLQQILSSVQQVTEMANDIAKSISQHSTITRNITRSMVNISRMVREIKQAVAEQARGASRVSRVSEQMRDDSRFVFRSANQQVQAVTGVSKNMERISEMVSMVSRSLNEQASGVSHVAQVAEEVRDSVEQEKVQMGDLDEIVDRVGRHTREFVTWMDSVSHHEERAE